MWWRREFLGLYAPTLEREPDGKIVVLQWLPLNRRSSNMEKRHSSMTNCFILTTAIL
jgi:hypothetical protein